MMYELGIKCRYLLAVDKNSISLLGDKFLIREFKNSHAESVPEGARAKTDRDKFIGVNGGRIVEINTWNPLYQKQCKEFVDGSSHVVMPGLINGHTHLAMTLFRGLEDDLPFNKWLFERILPLEARFVNSEFVRIGTELAALECIRFGVTTVNDMYFFADTTAGVLDRAGLRGVVGQPFLDFSTPEDNVFGVDKIIVFEQLFEKYKGHPRISTAVAPHAPYTCKDDLLKRLVELAVKYSVPIHIHVSETKKELEDSVSAHGKTPIKRLYDLGVLGGAGVRTIAAHCVHLTDEDIELLKRSGAGVVYNPDSNMKLSAGIAPITSYRSNGIPVAFGTDGAASNNDLSIFGAMDLGTKLQKLSSGDNTAMVAKDAVLCSTLEGARVLGLENQIGSLEVGKEADIILVNLDYPHLQPMHDIGSLLVYSTQGLEVDTVICGGRILMRDRRVLSLDQERIFSEANLLREKIEKAYFYASP